MLEIGKINFIFSLKYIYIFFLKAPTGISSREFVQLRGYKTLEDGTIIYAITSINQEDIKVEKYEWIHFLIN